MTPTAEQLASARETVELIEKTLGQPYHTLATVYTDELPDPQPEFDDWRDAAAHDAGVPRFGEI